MKKLINRITAYLLCATALLSCAQELEPGIGNSDEIVIPEGYVLQTFSALSEQTKTSIVSGNTVWNKEDKILVLYTDGTASDPFALTEGEGTTAGKFQGLVPEGKTASYAIYPHDVYSSVSESTVNVTIASEQPGTFAAGNIAVAKVEEENNMSFRNVNSFLVFQLKEGSQVTKVEVSSVDGSPLAGIVAVDCSGETPTAGEVSEASPSVSMTTDGEGIYYMSIVSGVTHAQGLKMTYFAGEEETGVYYLNRNLTIAVNTMYQLGEVETDNNYYVSVEGAGARNGMNWANAFSKADMLKRITLSDEHSDATNQAKFAALDGAVFHMAAGTYDWGTEVSISIDEEEEVSFTVMGGYDASTSERNLETNATVFTGNGEHQIFALGGNMDVEFDGVNFVSGYVDGNGGALQISSGAWSFTDCKFSENEAAKNGGAISISGGSLSLENCDFADNVALNDDVDRTSGNGYGGAIDSDGAMLSINGGTFSGNVAWRGGALSIINCGEDATITNVTFIYNGNENTRDGGAIYSEYSTKVIGCTVSGSTAKYGAGIYAQKDITITVYGGTFENNSASGNGGAISVGQDAVVDIKEYNGSPTYFLANSSASFGGALDIETSNSKKDNKINNAIFKGNHSNYGGAVEVYGNLKKSTTKAYFNSCIFGGSEDGDANYASHATEDAHGGVMFVEDDTYVNIGLSTFEGNHSDTQGGAICVKGWGVLQLFRDSFVGNYAYTGGALYTEKLHEKYPDCFIDECSFDSNYITVNYGCAMNINGVNNFCMHNTSVSGSYTTGNKTDQKKGLLPSWIAIDGVQASSSISNCSIIGDVRRYSASGNSFTTLTDGTALIAVWGGPHYFTNNIIVPESDGVASIGGAGSDKVDLAYTHYNKLIGVDVTDNGGNVSGLTATDFDDMTWSADASTTYYWKWNGTINNNAPDMTNQSDVRTRVNSNCSDFVKWSGSDFNMDQRNVARSGDWWPGAYQGNMSTDNVYLKITTYNVLRPEGRRDEMSMEKEEVRQTLAETIAATQSDIIGFGELDESLIPGGDYDLEALCSSMKDYTWSLNWPNEISKSGWLSPTYSTSCNYSEGYAYNKQKLELVESGYVWLSKSEEKWYNNAKSAYDKVGNPDRTCVWTKFRHKNSGKIFWVFVTHLPTKDQGGQENMSNVVNKFAQEKCGTDPAILLGDMNANPSSTAYSNLLNYWSDGNENTWGTMSGSSTSYYYSVATYSAGRNDRRIDHIMTKGCTASAYQTTVITYKVGEDDWCPSDHLPVTAKVAI